MKSVCALVLAVLSCYTATCNGSRPTPALTRHLGGSSSSSSPAHNRTAVILDHDGGVEDLIAMMLLLLEPRTKLLMVSYIEADSIKEVAINTTLKLLHYLNRTDVPLAVSTLQPRNAFPMLYRAGPLAADVLPALNPPNLQLEALSSKVVSKQAGQDALTQLLLKQEEPVTIIATGPLTNIAYALNKHPAVADKISRIWWMGGTLRHPGNVFNESNSDGSAEWNVFADPQAAGVVWASKVPVTLIPLDATNKVPITPRLLYKFGEHQHSHLAHLVGAMYAPTVTWVYLRPHDPYYAWDSLNAVCFLEPSICKLQQETVQLVLEGPSQGAMRVSGGPSGSPTHGQGGSSLVGSSTSSASGKAAVLSRPKQVTAAVDAHAGQFDEFLLKAFNG